MRLKHADRVEVLAPAGSTASMRAALNAGADAVYMGGSRFGARAYAENPDETEFLKAIDEVHLRGRRLYLTLNTLLKDQEMERELYAYVRPMYEQGLDGVIVQDLGVLSFLREAFPGMPLHASTQMTVTGVPGAQMAASLGVSRVVPARELTIPEVKEIAAKTGLEVEVFIHGALCYCYSGQCFLSSFIGGRSGNRGRCAGPCRLPYEVRRDGTRVTRPGEEYVLSLKDLCGLYALPDLLDAGVYSLKIEGRMKSPVYAAGVASVYREYADRYLEEGRGGYRVEEKDIRFLKELFDRGGFTDYWFYDRGRNPGKRGGPEADSHFGEKGGREVTARTEKPEFRRADEAVIGQVEERFLKKKEQEPVRGMLSARKGEVLTLRAELALPERTVEVVRTGAAVEAARKQAVTEADLRRQMEKTGNSPFFWEQLEIDGDTDGFVPVSALNELRRETFAELEEKAVQSARRTGASLPVPAAEETAEGETGYRTGGRREWQVYVEDLCYLEPLLERPVDSILIDCACLPSGQEREVAARCHQAGKKCYLGMPYIFRKQACAEWDQNRDRLREAGFDGFLVRNPDEAGYLEQAGLPGERIGEATAYTMNRRARSVWKAWGLSRFLLPVELNRAELRERRTDGDGLLLYGFLPVMVSAGCIRRTTGGCTGKPDWHTLTDRKKECFPVRNVCRYCYNVMYNSKPLSLHGCRKEAEELNPGFYRIHLTRESPETAMRILDSFLEEFSGQSERESREKTAYEFTRGHFRRGVE